MQRNSYPLSLLPEPGILLPALAIVSALTPATTPQPLSSGMNGGALFWGDVTDAEVMIPMYWKGVKY